MTWVRKNLAQVIVWIATVIVVAFAFGAKSAATDAAIDRIELRQDQVDARLDKLGHVVEDLRDVAQDLRIQVGIMKAENTRKTHLMHGGK